ncbi:ras-related protein Rab-17 isoform X1 [Zonotrichia leucophrys gambelii]|uniref:ras-related protein Rab-17 isoform X1 n=1 Tax=Zonotrichia leucophrys gambelii TaxID=257770 RepID=UPI0031407834
MDIPIHSSDPPVRWSCLCLGAFCKAQSYPTSNLGSSTQICCQEGPPQPGAMATRSGFCSFFTQILELDEATVKFEIWDTAGQEKYQSVCHLYYRDAHAALIVYDIANKETFSRAKLWLEELEKKFLPDEIVVALVGNKTDLAAEREVTTEEGEDFARTKGLLFMETSAKSNHQVNDVFMAVVQELLRREKEKAPRPSPRGSPTVDLRMSGTRCCRS